MVVKFPLEMKNGIHVRTINDLREHFDLEKVIGYFLNGKLLTWLESRYYDEEAEAISHLDKNDEELGKKICDIFNIEYNVEDMIDSKEIEQRNKRIAKLKQYTDDMTIIENIDFVVFNQKELEELYKKDINKIYLCSGNFLIPKNKTDLIYVVVGNPIIEGLVEENKSEGEINSFIDINERIADKIRLKPYIESKKYVIYFKDWNWNLGEEECFQLYNKKTDTVKSFHIDKGNEKWTKLIGIYESLIVAYYNYTLFIFNIDTLEKTIVETDIRDNFYNCIYNQYVLYMNKKNVLILYDIISKKKRVITNKVSGNKYYILNNFILFAVSENGWEIWKLYNISTNNINGLKELSTILKHEIIEHKMSYGNYVYFVCYNVWDDRLKLIKFDILNPEHTIETLVNVHYTGLSEQFYRIQHTPYYIYILDDIGFPMYCYNMNTNQITKIANNCGYYIKKTKYVNSHFQVVGNYVYFKTGDDNENNKPIYKINLNKEIKDIEILDEYN